MVFMGSKNRISKFILPHLLDERCGRCYVEPFVGGGNMIDKVDGRRIGNDCNPYLIAMWRALQGGWVPPTTISREYYNEMRDNYNNGGMVDAHIIGYVGYNGSYGGRFFSGGYSGSANGKRDYILEKYNNIMKQLPSLLGVTFTCGSYDEMDIPDNSVIYCDPPYCGTKSYDKNKFDYDKFWDWCRMLSKDGHVVFISEYNAPADFECVWSKVVNSSLTSNTGAKKGIEKLFRYMN